MLNGLSINHDWDFSCLIKYNIKWQFSLNAIANVNLKQMGVSIKYRIEHVSCGREVSRHEWTLYSHIKMAVVVIC